MADVFAEDWNFAAREQISVHEALPLDAGSTSCRVITDGPNEDFEELSFVMMAAIAAARREVMIMTPYFLPPAELIAAPPGAALRGVRTLVLLPQRNNPIARASGRARVCRDMLNL